MLPTPYHVGMTPLIDRETLEKLLVAHDEDDDDNEDVSSDCSSASDDDETTLRGWETSTEVDSEIDEEYTERYEDDITCNDTEGQPHVHFMLSHNDIRYFDRVQDNERLLVWYTDDEYLSFSNEIVALSIKLSTSHNAVLHETEYQTARGLEHKSRQQSQERRQRYADLLRAVFTEYERQCWNAVERSKSDVALQGEYKSDELVAIQAHRITAPSAQQARQRGLGDEDFVRQMYAQEAAAASHQHVVSHADLPPRTMCRKGSITQDMVDVEDLKLLAACVREEEDRYHHDDDSSYSVGWPLEDTCAKDLHCQNALRHCMERTQSPKSVFLGGP